MSGLSGSPARVSATRALSYRPEIDGLRALAILPVMGFHAGFPGFRGGFLGVDVFFVISGYLITSLILIESAQDRFSLRAFWARRARRILPLLTVVILSCLPAAWWLLARQDITDFWQSLVAIALFASNILFWREGTYFGTAAELKPLLHTWSLAVEEQFYLIFPLVAVVALRWGRTAFGVGVALACALSLALYFVYQLIGANTAFFWLPMRGWQLLTGSLCALALIPKTAASSRPARASALSAALAFSGLVLIVIAMVIPNGVALDFGVAGFLVTAGTALVIRFAQPGTWTARALSLRALVGVGLISYGAYLWHVPLLVFARHALALGGNPEIGPRTLLPVPWALALCALSLALAALTWRWIEQPFRQRARVSPRTALVAGAGGWALIGAFAATTALTDWQQRAHLTQTLGAEPKAAREFLHYMKLNEDWTWPKPAPGKGPCVLATRRLDETTLARITQCRAERGKGVLLIGDSHAQGLHTTLAQLVAEDGFFVTIASAGCRMDGSWCFYPQLEEALAGRLADTFATVIYTEAGSSRILDAHGRADSQAAFVNPEEARFDTSALDRLFARLAAFQAGLDAAVIVAGPHYEPRINLKTAQPLMTGWVPRPTIRAQFNALDAHYATRAQTSGLGYAPMMIDPLAPEDRVLHDGCLLYFDLDHFSACGSQRLANRLRVSGHPLAAIVGPGR